MLSIILSVFPKHRPVCIQAALVISYYSHIVIEGTAPGVGRGKELLLLVEDRVHPNPIAHGLVQTACDPLHICHSCMALVVLGSCKLWVTLWTLKVNFSYLPCYLAWFISMVNSMVDTTVVSIHPVSACFCCMSSSVTKVAEECVLYFVFAGIVVWFPTC